MTKTRVPIFSLKGTVYDYLVGNKYVIFSNNVTMTKEEFEKFEEAGVLEKRIESWAKNPKRLNDYHHAIKNKELRPVFIPVKPKTAKKKPKKEVPVVESTQKKLWKKFKIPKDKSIVIFWVMLFTAIGSASMSIYHATAFLHQGGKPLFVSALTGVLLVTFASTGFTASRYFWEQGSFARIFSIPFLLITVTLIGYIAFSTTSVSYGQFRDEEVLNITGVQKEISSLELYGDVQKNIAETEKFIRSIPKWRGKNTTDEEWERSQKLLIGERNKLDELRKKAISLKEASGGGTIEQKEISITNVYDFLSDLFGVNSRILRFIIYVIPAVFYDIVAPFGFTVVFFLLEDKKEPEKKTFVIRRGVV